MRCNTDKKAVHSAKNGLLFSWTVPGFVMHRERELLEFMGYKNLLHNFYKYNIIGSRKMW